MSDPLRHPYSCTMFFYNVPIHCTTHSLLFYTSREIWPSSQKGESQDLGADAKSKLHCQISGSWSNPR